MTDNNLNPLTNLPEKAKPTTEANLEPIDLLKVLPSGPSVRAPINTFNPYEFSQYKFDQKSDRNLISGMNQESNRASNQSVWAKGGNAVFGGLLGAVGVAIEDIGYMLDVENNAKVLADIDMAESNWMSNIGKSIKEYSHEAMPIYRKDPNSIFNPSDWGSYFSALNMIIENAIGFAIPGGAVMKGVGMTQKMAAYSRLLRVSKATAGIARLGTAGYISNIGESKMMALETFEETKRDGMENYGLSEEEATRRAGVAARDMYLWNKTLLATNMFELHGLSKLKLSRGSIKKDELKTLGKRYKEGLTKFSSDNLVLQGLSEYAEETGQGVLSNEASYRQTEGLERRALKWDEDPFQEQNSNLFIRAIDQFMTPETQYEGIIGFFAGAGQRVVTERLAGDKRLKYLQEEYDNQQKVLTDTEDFLKNKVNDHKELEKLVAAASLNSDDNMVELIRKANLVKIANRNFRAGTAEGLEALMQDRIDQNIDGAQEDFQFVKSLEKQWNNALRFRDGDITEKVFHAKQSISLAQERMQYLQEQAAEVEAEIEKTPTDQTLHIQKDQIGKDMKEMELVLKGLGRALKTVSSKGYENKLREAKEKLIQAKLKQQQDTLSNQKKKKENKNFFSTVSKTLKERVSSIFKKDETTPIVPEIAPEVAPEVVAEVAPEVKVKKTRKKKTVEESLNTPPVEKKRARKAKTIVQENTAQETQNPDQGSKFTYVNPDGSLEMQDAIPGNELPYIAEVQGDVLELTPATNSLEGHSLNNEFNTLSKAFESETPLKPGDKFLATSPAIYQKNETGQWELVKKGTVEKFVSSTDTALDAKQQAMRELALKISSIVGAPDATSAEADDGVVKEEIESIDDFIKNNNITEEQLKDEENKLIAHLEELGLKLDTEHSFEDIITRIIKNVKGRFLKQVLKGLNSLVGRKLKTKFVFSTIRHEDAAGQYFSHDDVIKIYIPNLSLRVFTLNKRGREYQQETNIVEVFNKVFIHELIHAFTILKLRANETNAKIGLAQIMTPNIAEERLVLSRSDQKTVDALNRIFDFLKDNELLKEEYGVSNIVELVTEALSNEGFAEKLKSIELPAELRYKTENDNVFDNIILYISKLVNDLLNLGSNYDDGTNALESIAAIINDFGVSYSEADQQSFMKINKAEEKAREFFKYGKTDQAANLGNETRQADDMVGQLTAAQKLDLMRASTELFSTAAERLLEENPDMSFDSIESFYRVMKEISHTISRDVMKNIFPYIKGFYSPTFQTSPEVNMQINGVDFNTIFLNDTELEQLIEAANNVFNSALPEEMLTEEKVFGAQQDTDFRLSSPEGEAQYNRRADPSNQLAFLHRIYEQEEDGGIVWRMDTEQFIDDYASLLDPDVVYPGAEFDVKVVDDNSIPMYLPGASENEMTTWGEIKTNKEHYMKVYGVKSEKALRELLLPIAVYNGDKIIAYIHNAEFINPLRVQGDEAALKVEAKKLLAIRKAIIEGKATKLTIESNRPGRIWFNEEAQVLSEVFPEGSEETLIIGVKKEGQFVGHNTKEVKQVINDESVYPGFPYILVPMGSKGHMAIGATPEFLSEEVVDSLVNVIHIAMHDGPLSDALQKVVDSIIETMEIDIRGEKGLQEYVSTFLYNFVPPKEFDSFREGGYRSALDAFIQTRMGQISSDNHFINFTGNSVDFGIGNSAKTFSLSKQTPAADKQVILDLLRDHISNMRLNVSLPKLQANKAAPVVLISRDGMKVINEGGSYVSLIMDGLTTKIRPIDLENGKFSLTYQPAIYFNLKETAQEDTVDEVSAEPDSRPTEAVKVTPAATSQPEIAVPNFTSEEQYHEWAADNSVDARELALIYLDLIVPKEALGYVEQIIKEEKLYIISGKDFDAYGDPNWRKKNPALNLRYINDKNPSFRGIDDRVERASERAGVEITVQDVIEFIMNNSLDGNKVDKALIEKVKVRYKEITGKTLTKITAEKFKAEPLSLFEASATTAEAEEGLDSELQAVKDSYKASNKWSQVNRPIPGVANNFQRSEEDYYHGTGNVQIDDDGNLVLNPSENFDGQTTSVSFTDVPAVALDYMDRKAGNIILKIKKSALPNLVQEDAVEFAHNSNKPLVISKENFRIINVPSAFDYTKEKKEVMRKFLGKPTWEVFVEALQADLDASVESEIAENERADTPMGYQTNVSIRGSALNEAMAEITPEQLAVSFKQAFPGKTTKEINREEEASIGNNFYGNGGVFTMLQEFGNFSQEFIDRLTSLIDGTPGQSVERITEDAVEAIVPSSQLAQELGIEGPKKKARRGKIIKDDMIATKKEEVSNKTKCKT